MIANMGGAHADRIRHIGADIIRDVVFGDAVHCNSLIKKFEKMEWYYGHKHH